MIDRLIAGLRRERLWRRIAAQWRRAQSAVRAMPPLRPSADASLDGKALVIPCDPWCVVGSRGDEAMILSCVQHIRARHPDWTIDVLTDSTNADADCRALGLCPHATWNEPIDVWFPAHANEYAEVFILGADVTDGVYGWPTAAKLLAYYDLFARLGRRVRYLGFSWSQRPDRMLKRVMRRLAPGLPLPVRDPVSGDRLAAFTRHRPIALVADAAFCLLPRLSARTSRHGDWVAAQKAAGRRVIAVNVHNMFNDAETKSEAWETALASVLNAVLSARTQVQLLLLPHDNRPGRSDLALLSRLAERIDGTRAHLVDEVMEADEIKAVVGRCDGLVSGRMHAAIAALGSGVPAFGLVYQGKFEGLWRHFGLSDETLMMPGRFLSDPTSATEAVCRFVDGLPSLRERVARAWPDVRRLAEANFA